MASKKMKKLGKVAALLGAAYATSKMGKGNEDGITNYDFDTEDGITNYDKQPSMLDKIKKGVKDYATKDYVIKSPDRNPNLPTKDTANFSFLGGAKTGAFVTAKTKMGKNKKTRIC
jgi:hypothetical protein